MTHSFTTSSTFTRTGAKHIASKVLADLRGMQDYYEQPNESLIWEFYEELTELLVEGCLASVEYGFMRNNRRIVTLYYKVRSDGSLSDEKSGRVYAKADISNAVLFSVLTYSIKWASLSNTARQQIEARLPIKRVSGKSPQDGSGYWVTDKSYSSQDVGAQRWTFRPY